MKRFYKIILPMLLIFGVQKVSAQVQPKTISIGANLHVQDNRYNNSKTNITQLNINPDLQYFYKENRAIVGGFIYNRSKNQYRTYSSIDGAEHTWQDIWFNTGAYLGLRQHHPISEKFHVFTEFGFMYLQEKSRSEYISGSLSPEYQHGNSHENYSIIGYGNLGLMYFINKRFILESTIVNARIQYRRPMNADYSSNEWIFQLYGANQVSFALRYFFQVGSKEK